MVKIIVAVVFVTAFAAVGVKEKNRQVCRQSQMKGSPDERTSFFHIWISIS